MEDVTFIIMGATGDLTKRKIIPAIYKLVKDKKVKKFAIIGAARSDIKAGKLLSDARRFVGTVDDSVWNKLSKASYYKTLDFNNSKDYGEFKAFVEDIELKNRLKGNRLFYLSTLPRHFDNITHNLDASGIAKSPRRRGGWIKVVYEKPFGDNLKSAKQINKCVNRIFDEKQIYRVDHYLGKELVGNIALLRFTNRILEPLWCRDHVDSVQIILKESIGLEERGNFYDKYGALKDVVQNHALQLLALTAMEMPKKLSGEHIRDEKAKILKKVKVRGVLLGQYQGYKSEKGIKANSNTETFAVLKVEINNNRWKGVPFYIKVGKHLDKRETKIHINFKRVECLLESCPRDTNYFTINVQPNEGFVLKLNSKVKGRNFEVAPVEMSFLHKTLYGVNTPEAYEVLLENIIKGDQSLFVRNDEIESAWKIVDKVRRGRVHSYKKGSLGPKELEQWSLKNKVGWTL